MIQDLIRLVGQTNDLKSKADLARVARRELQSQLVTAGLTKRFLLTEVEKECLRRERKLECVREVKLRTGMSLMEAKRAVEGKMLEMYGSSNFHPYEGP